MFSAARYNPAPHFVSFLKICPLILEDFSHHLCLDASWGQHKFGTDFRHQWHIWLSFMRMTSLIKSQTSRQCGYLGIMGTNPHYPSIVCSLSTCTYMIGLALPFHLPRCKSLPCWRVHFIRAQHAIKGLFV